MKISKFLLSLFVLSIILVSCDDDDEPALPKGDYENGIILSGEGTFSGGSGSIYYVSDDYVTTESLIYSTVNGADLGTYLQSIAFDDDSAYIVVDNQNTITAVDRYTFEKLGAITTGLVNPRYMTIVNGVGYATNWGSTSDATDDFVAVIDLDTYTVTSKILVGNGPERIIAKNDNLYVSHKGAYTTNNIISVINISTQVVTEITVNDNPDELFFDNSGDLVVLSEGGVTYDSNPPYSVLAETIGAISRINISTNMVTSTLEFSLGTHPSLLDIDENGNLYYSIYNSIYKIEENAITLPTSVFLQTSAGSNYGMAINGSKLYVVDAGDYSSEGDLLIYDLTTTEFLQSFKAPIAASKIYFN